MSISYIIDFLHKYEHVTAVVLWIAGVLLIIQILPLKFKPYDIFFGSLGSKLNKGISDKLEKSNRRIDEIAERQEFNIKDIQEKFAADYRWRILDFANSCKNGESHTKEEWEHVITQINNYDEYCEDNGIKNDQITVESEYLREKYKKRLLKRDWLTCKDSKKTCVGHCVMDKEGRDDKQKDKKCH